MRYVKQSMIFSAVYAKGEDCHNTTGPYPGNRIEENGEFLDVYNLNILKHMSLWKADSWHKVII